MALRKQAININFAKGIDSKSDPKEIPVGSFENLSNSVFTKQGLLQKRNGYTQRSTTTGNYITTYNGNLLSIGTELSSFSPASATLVDKGYIQPLSLTVSPIVRSASSQTQVDSVLSPVNGNLCTVYTESNGFTTSYKFVVTDVTGEHVIEPQVLVPTFGAIVGGVKVFILGNNFIIVFGTFSNPNYHLQYVAVNIVNPTVVAAATDISTTYLASVYCAFDGIVANNNLYLAYNANDIGGAVRISSLNQALTASSEVAFAGIACTVMSVYADTTQSNSVVYANFFDFGAGIGYTLAVDPLLNTILAPTAIITSGTILNITSAASNQVCSVFYEVDNTYGYDSGIESNYINLVTVTQSGVVGTPSTILKGVGLASKAFKVENTVYFCATYVSDTQPFYVVSNRSGQLVARFAYTNGAGYFTQGLPAVTTIGKAASFSYLRKDLVQPVNKTVNAPSSAGFFTQTGINNIELLFDTTPICTAEIGENLNISGGFLWTYDGSYPVEQGFFVYPDNVEVTTSTSGGALSAQLYNYVAIYSYVDNKGNPIQSNISIPVSMTTSGTTSSNTIFVPTLRLSYKTGVQIQIYRWSVAQQEFLLVNSVDQPLLNDPTVDYVQFVDIKSDEDILGNQLLYTEGNVVGYDAAPACSIMTMYQNRLFVVDSENPSTVWFSNTISAGVPVTFSQLFTIPITPTISAGISSGPITALYSMDSSLIILKKDSIFYLTGNGLTTTGVATGNFQGFSPPNFITSTVGSDNQTSICLIDKGIVFQSDKGYWLLDRSLQVSYIGAPVEVYNDSLANSSVVVPGTNQIRITLDVGKTLVYDYFFGQWNIFSGVPAISSTLFEGLHTYLDSNGRIFQEQPGNYNDGSTPVAFDVKTGPISMAGIQGYQNFDAMLVLGQYFSPHKLIVEFFFDYETAPSQQAVITPLNFAPVYGADLTFGQTSPYGGPPALEQWKVFAAQRKCMSFQIRIYEQFDPNFDVPSGQGLTLSALTLIVQIKKGFYPLSAQNQV